MHKELKPDKIITTIAKLESRIKERFPNSGIGRVCGELHFTANNAQSRIDALLKPNRWIRAGIVVAVVIFVGMLVFTVNIVEWEYSKPNITEVIQITEALINNIILVGAALFFLLTFERRLKRKQVLRALHELRSIAHIIDMHQLTKDPSVLSMDLTASSPKRGLSEFQLHRYLDYCSEMFSLIGKVAALFSENFPEPEIVSAASDVENLCSGLSRKVWQKMVFLNK